MTLNTTYAIYSKQNLNKYSYPWRYSPEEPRPTKVFAARWQYRGALRLAKQLSLNLNFSFLNRISLLLISSSYSIALTRLGGPHSRPYTSRKINIHIHTNIHFTLENVISGKQEFVHDLKVIPHFITTIRN